MNQVGRGRFHAYSAGSFPTGKVNPLAIELLGTGRIPHEGARSKSWDEFATPGAPQMDFILTVCDNAPAGLSPSGQANPVTAHWGVPDPPPSKAPEAKRAAFVAAAAMLRKRIELLVNLPSSSSDGDQGAAAEIGNSEARCAAAEGIGTAFLLAIVIGRDHG